MNWTKVVVDFCYFCPIALILQSDPRRAENFDAQFKSIPVDLTPLSRDARHLLEEMMNDKDQFADFDFVNPVYKDT